MDRSTIRLMQQEMSVFAKTLAAKYGMTVEKESGSYSSSTCKLTVGFTETSAEDQFTIGARIVGIPADSLGKTFKAHGDVFTITGVNPNRPKFPITAKSSKGKAYKFPVGIIRAAMLLDSQIKAVNAAVTIPTNPVI